ncbi:hypothetical protein [Halomonas sp.]|uniref:hypothetical protein n=1 Tax=Halomonas sp. TaxID=1486246 RepID=UPI0025B9E5D1|nr:hypothetical protein [Halomonas sp.]
MLKLGLLLLIAPILLLLGLYFWEMSDVRECTYAGGYWDYMEGVCRDTPQPFVSWLERYPLLVNGGMLLSVAGTVMCAAGMYIGKR